MPGHAFMPCRHRIRVYFWKIYQNTAQCLEREMSAAQMFSRCHWNCRCSWSNQTFYGASLLPSKKGSHILVCNHKSLAKRRGRRHIRPVPRCGRRFRSIINSGRPQNFYWSPFTTSREYFEWIIQPGHWDTGKSLTQRGAELIVNTNPDGVGPTFLRRQSVTQPLRLWRLLHLPATRLRIVYGGVTRSRHMSILCSKENR